MIANIAQLIPAAAKFSRQIVPPVVATLIAAGLISAYNRAFSTHLSQPRMSALHAEEAAAPAATVTTVAVTRAQSAPVTETITIYEEAVGHERLWEKDATEETGKDQSGVRVAAEPAAAPAPARTAQAPRPEPKPEARHEARRVASVEVAQAVAPAPVIVAPPAVGAMPPPQERAPYPPHPQQSHPQQPPYQPPPIIVGTPPAVTVPDRSTAQPPQEEQAVPGAPRRGAFGTFVHVLKPSTWFAHAREFGEKIEQVGNDILPSIRQ